MPRDGSGTYTRAVAAYVAGNVAEPDGATGVNTEMDDIATALTGSLAADGSKAWGANQSAAGFWVNLLGNTRVYTTTGSANAYVITTGASLANYTTRLILAKLSFSNTGACTLAVDGGAATSIKINGSSDPASGDLVSGTIHAFLHDGTNWQALGQIKSPASSTDNAVARYDGTTGDLQDSAVTIDDTNNLTVPGDAEIISTNAGATEGPLITLYRNSASPVANDQVGALRWFGESDTGVKVNLGRIVGEYQDPANGAESMLIKIRTTRAGTDANRLLIATGIYTPSASGGDKGLDTINATTLYEAGTSLASKYEAIDADILRADVGDTLTAGYLSDSYSGGTVASGTYTPAPATGQENIQHIVNGGAFTLAPPASPCTVVLEIINNASAGAITTSGFTLVDGDAFTLTDGDDFMCYITKTQNFSRLTVAALQ